MWEERNTGSNLPAQIELYATGGRRVQVPVHGQGRRVGQQVLPLPGDQGGTQPGPDGLVPGGEDPLAWAPRPARRITWPSWSAAPAPSTRSRPPSTPRPSTWTRCRRPARWTRTASATSSSSSRCWRSPGEAGIGAQFGGKYFCHDVRVVRLPRHGASCPVAIAVSCSADRQAKAQDQRERGVPRAARNRPCAVPARDTTRPTLTATSCGSTCRGRWPRSGLSCPATPSRPGSR